MIELRTLADLKRFVRVGMVIDCEHLTRPEVSGRRTITKVQTNAIVMSYTKPDGTPGETWGRWDSAKHVQFHGDNSVTFLDRSGLPVFAYRFVATVEEVSA